MPCLMSKFLIGFLVLSGCLGAYLWTHVIASRNICTWEKGLVDDSIMKSPVCTTSPLSYVDSYGRLMYSVVKMTVNNQDPKQSVSQAIFLPRQDIKLPRKEAIKGTKWMIPLVDEDNEYDQFNPWLKDKIYSWLFEVITPNTHFFPLRDRTHRWKDIQEAQEALKIAGGVFLPEPGTEWANVNRTSDEAISRMIFSGYAGMRLKLMSSQPDESGAIFVVDLSKMAALEVRPKFAKFGATAYFNKERRLVKMEWAARDNLEILPGNPNWEHVKWVFRCSLLLSVTATEHLMMNHLIFSNIASTASREYLPKDHPIRRLLKPFNHRTPSINVGASQLLTQENGLLHRATSLTFKGLRAAFVSGLNEIRFTPHPMNTSIAVFDYCVKNNIPFAYAEDGLGFYKVVRDFVTQYVDVYFSSDEAVKEDESCKKMFGENGLRGYFKGSSGLPLWDNMNKASLVDILAFYIFEVTGMHLVVGNVAEYLISPDIASPRIREGVEVADVEASQLGLLIAVLTGLKAPMLMNDFTHLLRQDEKLPQTTAIFNEFQANLTKYGIEIDTRNQKREWPFYGFHPKRMLSSVSI